MGIFGIIIVACMPNENINNIQIEHKKSKYEMLGKIGELRKANVISEEEFEEEKRRILESEE